MQIQTLNLSFSSHKPSVSQHAQCWSQLGLSFLIPQCTKVLVVYVAKVFEVEHEGLHPLEGIPQIVSRSSPSQAMQPWLCWASTASLIPPPRRVENWVEVLRMVAVPAALVSRSAHQCMQAVHMPILPLLGNTFRGGMQGCLHISNI